MRVAARVRVYSVDENDVEGDRLMTSNMMLVDGSPHGEIFARVNVNGSGFALPGFYGHVRIEIDVPDPRSLDQRPPTRFQRWLDQEIGL